MKGGERFFLKEPQEFTFPFCSNVLAHHFGHNTSAGSASIPPGLLKPYGPPLQLAQLSGLKHFYKHTPVPHNGVPTPHILSSPPVYIYGSFQQ